MKRCFYDGDLRPGILELSRDESHHLCTVSRAKKGIEVQVLNGAGSIANGVLVNPHDKFAAIEVNDVLYCRPREKKITLIQAVLTNNNSDYIVREATAIGVSEIIFVETNNCESFVQHRLEAKSERWRALAITACKQSGQPFLPKINYSHALQDIDYTQFDTKILASLTSDSVFLRTVNFGEKICLAIGPEGDFSKTEYDFFTEQGFVSCRLARNVLRSETAAIYALSIIDQLTANDD